MSTRAVAGAMADERAQWAAKSAVSLVTAPMREAGAARKLPPRPSGRLRERADGLAARASDPWARSAVAPLLPAGPSSPGLADAPATGSADLLKRLIEVQSRRQALRAADAEHRHAEAAAAEGAADQQARAQAAAEHEAKAGEAARHAAFAVGQALAREEAARRGQNQCGQQGEQANRGGAEVRAVADQAQGTPAVEAPPAPEGFLDKMLAVTLGPVREHAAQVQAGITQAVLDAVSGVAGLDDLGQAACQEGEGMAARRELAEKERSDAQAMAETAAADAAWAQQEASDARSKARAAEDAARELAAQRGEMAQEDQSLGAEEASLVAAIVAEAQEVASRGETSPDLPDLGSIQAAGALLAALAGTAITEIDAAAVDVIDAVAAEFESLSGRKDIADAAADEAAKASAEAAGPAREALAELPGDVDLAVGQAEATGGDGIAAGLDALAAELDAV
ncbi:MAG: hypothetical protein FJ399_24545, partial [Verrucomicrobia bacterium]|nr:hypothetical protein [Verrucomicrobiota bacterium]